MVRKWRLASGMSLVEVILYLWMMVMATMLCGTIVQWYNRYLGPSMNTTRQLLEIHLAHDVLARDIRRAPADPDQWRVREDDKLIWSQGEIDVGWVHKKKKLQRIVGLYREDRQRWRNASRSKLLGKCDKVNFVVHESPHTAILRGVTVSVVLGTHTVTQFTAIREGSVA